MNRELMQRALDALVAVLTRDERNTCQHESTHRGGTIWEICDDCGAKWADDMGGRPKWKDPSEWGAANAVIAELRAALAAPVATAEPIAGRVEAMRAAIDKIMAVVDRRREPGWSYRNTITHNRDVIREQCAAIDAAMAAPVAPELRRTQQREGTMMSNDNDASQQPAPLVGAGSSEGLGPLPEADMSHRKALDDCDEEESYSAEAMEAERHRCYALGVATERERWRAACEAISQDLHAAQGAGEIERLREVVKACHQALFQAQEAAKMLFAKGEMLAAVVQGAREEFVRVPYGASHEDVAAINDWHKMAADALSAWENRS